MSKKKVLLEIDESLHEDVKNESRKKKPSLGEFYEEVISLGLKAKKNLSKKLMLSNNNKGNK
jgi:hypothetical protein